MPAAKTAVSDAGPASDGTRTTVNVADKTANTAHETVKMMAALSLDNCMFSLKSSFG